MTTKQVYIPRISKIKWIVMVTGTDVWQTREGRGVYRIRLDRPTEICYRDNPLYMVGHVVVNEKDHFSPDPNQGFTDRILNWVKRCYVDAKRFLDIADGECIHISFYDQNEEGSFGYTLRRSGEDVKIDFHPYRSFYFIEARLKEMTSRLDRKSLQREVEETADKEKKLERNEIVAEIDRRIKGAFIPVFRKMKFSLLNTRNHLYDSEFLFLVLVLCLLIGWFLQKQSQCLSK